MSIKLYTQIGAFLVFWLIVKQEAPILSDKRPGEGVKTCSDVFGNQPNEKTADKALFSLSDIKRDIAP